MATKAQLKHLRIKQFRGSTKDFSLTFDASKPLTLIYGENGSGKTTIADAIDFVGNGRVGSLERRGLGVLRPYWATLGMSHGDILVELSIDNQTWQAKAGAKGVAVTPVGVAPPKVEVLRRNSILQLVQEAPKEKYDALKPFIDISLVEQAEAALRKQYKESSAVLNNIADRIAENRDTLSRLFKESGSPDASADAWVKKIIANPPQDHSTEVAALRDAAQAISSVVSIKEQYGLAQAELRAAKDVADEATAELLSAEEAATTSDAAFERILSAAKEHFALHPVGDACPLCLSSERVDGLAEQVNQRLKQLAALTNARKQARDAQSKVEAKQLVLEGMMVRARASATAAEEKIAAATLQWKESHANVQALIQCLAQDGNLDAVVVDELNTASEAAVQRCAEIEKASTWYTSLNAVQDQIQKNVNAQKTVSQVLPRLQAALAICESQRRAFLDSILSSIAKEVGRLYEAIHPGEGLNKISLKLDPNKTGSLDLAAEFLAKQDQPPHAYFSESHLDSLGLCIFLALAVLREPERTLVVLDDVLGSIDEPHVDRLIEMLYVESKKFKHTLITTHYQPWREKFRWGWLANGQCEMLELGVWDAKTGIASAKLSQAPLIDLRQHLTASPPSIQSACATAGVLLEAICDYLTVRYECDVPRKKGRLTLGDLLPKVCEKKLVAALRVEVKGEDGSYVEVKIGEKLKALNEMAQLRNIFGCHYADLAHHLPQKDALEFATLAHEVGSALICDKEGWPGSDKSGSYWATRQETRRLHPLKKPT